MFFFNALYKIALVFRLPPAGEYDKTGSMEIFRMEWSFNQPLPQNRGEYDLDSHKRLSYLRLLLDKKELIR